MTHWRPPVRFGLGGVAIGDGFAPLGEADAHDALVAAWDAGIRYYDTSPFYGYGLSERATATSCIRRTAMTTRSRPRSIAS